MPTTLGLRHANLNVADLVRSIRFYREVFGLEVLQETTETITKNGREVELRQALLTTPGAGDLLALTQAASFPIGPGGVNHLGFVFASSADVEAAVTVAVAAGGTVLRRGSREGRHAPEVFAYLSDPDGYAIELSTQDTFLASVPAGIVVRSAGPDELAAAGELIAHVFVDGGFSPPESAEALRDAASRSAMSELLVAVDGAGRVLGAVYLVTAESPAHDVARPREVEPQLLAVAPAARGRRIGEALLAEVLRRAREHGFVRAVLSTQPTMASAHRLYERVGFRRAPERDWTRRGVPRLVYTLEL